MVRGTNGTSDGELRPLFQKFIDINPAIFWTADDDGRLTIASEAGARQLGLPQRIVEPGSHFDIVHPDDRHDVVATLRQARTDGSLLDVECRIRPADGSHRWMRVRARYDAECRQWHGAIEDIHDRREAEAALRIANQRLALALDANEAWVWDYDIVTGRFWFSDRWRQILGYDASEISYDMSDLAALVHPDDQAAVEQSGRTHLAGHSPAIEIDYRVRHKNGSWVWVQDRGRVTERDPDGRPLRAIGIRTDITARKAVEAQARASETYLKTLLDNITDAVIAVSPNGQRGFYNKAYAKLFLSDRSGELWDDFAELFASFEVLDADGRPYPDTQRPILRILRGETIEELEVIAVVRQTGRTYRLIYNGQPVYGADGLIELAVLTIRDITEKRAVQAALKASEERLRLATDGAGMGAWDYDVIGGTGIWSESACRLLGYPVDTHRIWHIEDFQSRIHPDDLGQALTDPTTLRDNSQSYVKQFRIVRADTGATRWVEAFGTCIPDATGQPARQVGVFFDITDRKLADDRLRDSEARLAAILESLEEGVVAVAPDDPDRGFMNGAFRRMFGSVAPDRITCATIDDAFHSYELIDAHGHRLSYDERPMIRLLQGERVEHPDLRVKFLDGRELAIICSGEPLFDQNGVVKLAVMVVRDITQQQKAEADLATLQQELIHVSRVSAMGTMAGSLAHELNQPLAAITNYAAAAKMMLNNASAIEPAREVLKRVGDEAVRAGQIISRLRRFITKGEVDRQAASLAGIVREALAIAHSDADTRGTHVKVKLDTDADIVLADRVQLQQVIFNVVRNAVEAMDGQLDGEITIASRRAGNMVELLIADRGPGLAPEVAAHLFEPFVTTKETGMGIGLPICQSIMRAHGGDIRAEARPSGGTVFILSLPPANIEIAAE